MRKKKGRIRWERIRKRRRNVKGEKLDGRVERGRKLPILPLIYIYI
jgi:hypothetical protein